MKVQAKKLYHLLHDVIHGYRNDDCAQFAAVISFYAIFSMLPMAMLSVAVFTHVLGSSTELVNRFQVLLTSVMPSAADQLFSIVKSALEGREHFSFISAGILILITTFLVSALERALDRVFRTEKKRNFFHSKIAAVSQKKNRLP